MEAAIHCMPLADAGPEVSLPLSGLRVIDISTLLAGGLISTFLGDFGADVIKVEHPQNGDPLREFGTKLRTGSSSWWTVFSRNKYCVALNKSLELILKQIRIDSPTLAELSRSVAS